MGKMRNLDSWRVRTNQARRETMWLYQFRTLCNPNVQRIIFHTNVAEHFIVENSLKKLRAWIQLHRSTILACATPDQRPLRQIRSSRKKKRTPQTQYATTTTNHSSPHSQQPRAGSQASTRRNQEQETQAGIRQMRNTLQTWLTSNTSTQGTAQSQGSQSLQQQGIPKVKMKRT